MVNKESLKRKNFNAEDFFASETAKKHGITNYPDKGQEVSILTGLMSTADMMQSLRDIFQKPVILNSTYRCKKLNDLLGSTDKSQHLQGLACDFVCPRFATPREIVEFLCNSDFIVDQCFNEGTWVHISRNIGPKKNRMQYGHYLMDPISNKRVFKSI